jgi:uncharacterized iron-regulated membrane protein
VGFYLTLPRGKGGFWKRWRQAWWVKWRATNFRINFDLHRAGGLWFWPMVFVFAWSSVMLTRVPVYERVTGALFDYEPEDAVMSYALPQRNNPKLGWRQAEATGQRLFAEQAALHGWKVTRPVGMAYIPQFGVYSYDVRTEQDIRSHGWDAAVWLDGDTGELRKVFSPRGDHTGNVVSTVLWGLHYGDIRDAFAYRLFVFLFGFARAMLCVTGVYIWWKKRKAQLLAKSRASAHRRRQKNMTIRELLESTTVRPRQAVERSGLTLSKNMKGLAPFWTKAKYGKMSIEGCHLVDTQTSHHSEARAIHDGKILITPGNAKVPRDLKVR